MSFSTSSGSEECSSPIGGKHYSGSISIGCGKSSPMGTFEKPCDYDTWAPCKKEAWDRMVDNPNAFFYRHVLPNEERKNGPWSNEERDIFIEALRKEPVEKTHWGLFARNIPGRVGYQCNAFYKKLIASGELQELAPDIPLPPPKQVDENGKTVQVKKKRPTSPKSLDNATNVSSPINYNLTEEKSCPVILTAKPNVSDAKLATPFANVKIRADFLINVNPFF